MPASKQAFQRLQTAIKRNASGRNPVTMAAHRLSGLTPSDLLGLENQAGGQPLPPYLAAPLLRR